MKKRLLSAFLALSMLCASVPVPAFAQGADGAALEQEQCSCSIRCTADGTNPDCPVCAADAAACAAGLDPATIETAADDTGAAASDDTPAEETDPEAQACHWQFAENPAGFTITQEDGVFYADAPRGNIPLEAVVSMLPQSLTVEAEADGEPVTVAISGWECPDYQCAEDSWPQEGSYAFTAQVDTDLQLDPVPAVTLRLTNMVQTLAVNNPTLNLADGSIWIENGRYSQPSAAYVPGSYTQYTGTITITGTSAWGYGSVHITGSGDFNIVLKDANIKPGYTQEYSYSVTNGMEIREGANVTLTLEGTNSIKGTRMANEYTGGMDGLYVAESTLNIVGSGTLNVSGGDSPRLLSGSAGGDALDVYSSTVTIKDNVKVTLSGGNYSNHNNAHMEIIGNGINVTNSGTVILGGNSQVTAQGGTAISSYDAGSTVQINGGTHTFNACGTVVSNAGNNIENCQVMGGKATFHLFSSNGQFAPLYTNGDNGISVTGGVAVFYTDVNYTLSGGGGKVKLGANACILEGDKQNSASFVEKTTSAKTKTVNKKYVEVFFDTGENYHTLTVNGLGSGGTGGGKYLPGNTVTLYAGTKDGYAVRQWKLVSGEGKLSNANSPYASFIMYDSDTTVEVEFAKLYDLTVEDGTITNPTGQTQFISNTQVTLEAKDRTAENMIFDKWEIVEGSGTFQDAASANTTFTTGEANTKIRACYYKAYKLVVNGADGSGMYKEGAQVSLQPNLTLEDKEFSHWEVVKGTIDISDPKAANATFTMPAEDVEVTAVYDDVKLYGDYVVTVISGSESDFKYTGGTTNILDFTGDGEYAVRLKAGVTDTLDRIRIRSSSPTITITDLTIVNRMPFEVGSGNVTIKLDGVNTFQTTHRQPTYHDRYAAIQKGTSGTLTITSAQGDGSTYGTLNLSCGTNGAGIGGKGATSTEAGQSASNITINGGTLNINTQNGAGIGGGGTKDSGSNAGTADNITINGGNITITTTGNGAGIGGGGSSVSNADAGSASNITVNGGKLSIQCTGGSAIGGGQVKDGNDGTRGSATNIYVKNNPTKFDAAVAGSGSTTSLLDSLGADGKVDSNVKDFAKYGTVNIEYGNATVTAVKVQPDDALVKPGDTQQFTTQITGTGNWAVEWTVTGNADPATTINALGLLTVGANETAVGFTVTATIQGTQVTDSVTVMTKQVELKLDTMPTANEITYGQTLADATFNGGSVVTTEGETVTGAFQWTDPDVKPQAGTHEYEVVFVPDQSWYKPLNFGKVSVTVNKATPTIAWANPTETLNYTGNEAAITAPTVTLVNGETYQGEITYQYKAEGDYTDGLPTDAGTYTVKATIAAQDNYNAASAEMTLTIEKIAPVSTAPAKVENLVYNGQPQTLVTAGTADGGTMVYSLEESGEYTTTIPTGTRAGDYTVWYYVKGDANHNDTAPAKVESSISPLAVKLEWSEPVAFTYDGSEHSVTATVENRGGDDLITLTYAGNTGTDAATYTAKVTALDNSDYTLTGATGIEQEWSIDPANLENSTLTLSQDTFTYNGQSQKPGVTVKMGGTTLVEGKDYTVTYSDDTTNVGTVTVTVTGKGNYTDTKGPATYTINPAKLTITGATLAAKTYDGTTAATVTEVTFDGLMNGESLKLNDTYLADAVYNSADAGNDKTATVIVTLNNDNYILPTDSFLLENQTIAKATATPVAGSMSVYTERKASYTYDLSALLPSLEGSKTLGTVSYTLGTVDLGAFYSEGAAIAENTLTLPIEKVDTREEKEIGTVQVTISSTNYEDMAATVTVNSCNRPVPDLTADAYERDYTGKALTLEELTLSAQYEGKDMEGTWAFKNEPPVNAGAHNVTLVFTPDDDAYGPTEVTAQVTIKQLDATIGLKLDPTNRIHAGDALPTAFLTYSGVLDGESIAPASFTVAGMPNDSSAAMEYTIAVSSESQQEIRDQAPNYNITFTTATLTILEDTVVVLPDPEIPDADPDIDYRVEQSGLTEVPEDLKPAGYDSLEKIQEALCKVAAEKMSGASVKNTAFYDVTLYVSLDDGKTWVKADEKNFPASGITVTLPYPEGTNAADYDFVVTHMVTVAMNDLNVGDVETPAVTKTADGLRFTVKSLSPVAVSWKLAPKTESSTDSGESTSPAATPAPTAAPAPDATVYYTCPACGHHDWTATDTGYRCDTCGYLETVNQLAGYGNVKGVYEPKTGSNTAGGHAVTVPQTGDTSNPALWLGLLLLSGLALGGITLYRRKKTQ